MIRLICSLLLVTFTAVMVYSCKSTERSEKCYELKEKKRVEAEQKQYDGQVESHRKMQSKETIKMLKHTDKQSKKLNMHRKPKSKPCSS